MSMNCGTIGDPRAPLSFFKCMYIPERINNFNASTNTDHMPVVTKDNPNVPNLGGNAA